MRNADRKYKFKPKTVGYFPSSEGRDRERIGTSIYAHMFTEDIHHNSMPIGGRSRRKPGFSVTVVPNDSTAVQIINYAFGNFGHRDRSGSITEIISGFIGDLAYHLSYFGRLHYEIVHASLSQQSSATVNDERDELSRQVFRLDYIPGRIFRLGNNYVQLIPRAEQHRVGKKYVFIPASDIWSVQLPKHLGSPRSHKRLIRSLVKASTPLPDFVMQSMKQLNEIRNFNFTDYHTQREIIAAYETASWGWTGRTTWDKSTLEYYQIYRDLQFALSMARMREHILSSANELLSRLHIVSHLQMNGLPSSEEIQNLITKLHSGEISLKDAFDTVQIQ